MGRVFIAGRVVGNMLGGGKMLCTIVKAILIIRVVRDTQGSGRRERNMVLEVISGRMDRNSWESIWMG